MRKCHANAFRRWVVAAFVVVAVGAGVAQSQPQAAPSLGELARQARAQKQPANQDDSSSNRAQALAEELEHNQDDAGAPDGFKTYNAGDYKLRVPGPFTVAGHDDSGVVLNTAYRDGARSMVMIGSPVLFSGTNNDEGFEDFAARFAGTYSSSPGCTKTSVGGHGAYQCALSKATLLGKEVSGNAMFVRGAKSIYPVLCVAPSESYARDAYNRNPSNYNLRKAAARAMQRDDQSTRNAWQTCDAILKSIVLKEDVAKSH